MLLKQSVNCAQKHLAQLILSVSFKKLCCANNMVLLLLDQPVCLPTY